MTTEHSMAPEIAGLSYEQARDELVDIVSRLERGGDSLESSLALWERGEALATRCQEWLDGARDRLAAVRNSEEGKAPLTGESEEPTDD